VRKREGSGVSLLYLFIRDCYNNSFLSFLSLVRIFGSQSQVPPTQPPKMEARLAGPLVVAGNFLCGRSYFLVIKCLVPGQPSLSRFHPPSRKKMRLVLTILTALLVALTAHAVPQGKGGPSQGSTLACFVCPPADNAGVSLGHSDIRANPIFCSYPAFPGGNPDDFYCTYDPVSIPLSLPLYVI
jgi:hypothetical protein